MMKITGLSHLFKWENLHNWWLTKYFFAPLYIYMLFVNSQSDICTDWDVVAQVQCPHLTALPSVGNVGP